MFFGRKKEEPPIIEFYCHPDYAGVVPEPKPASKHIADWFKKVPVDVPSERDVIGMPGLTIKHCIPVLDAMKLGYVMPLGAELGVRTNGDCSIIELKNTKTIPSAEFHSIEQLGGKNAPGYPAKPIKFINHWIIKTRPGWSTLFLPLVNNFGEYRFTCLGGLVDTDTYAKEVNFPAIWHAENYHGRVDAGTPLVVAIPINREALTGGKAPVRKITDAEFAEITRIQRSQDSRRGVYSKELREPRK